jgi:hypothetical protein
LSGKCEYGYCRRRRYRGKQNLRLDFERDRMFASHKYASPIEGESLVCVHERHQPVFSGVQEISEVSIIDFRHAEINGSIS